MVGGEGDVRVYATLPLRPGPVQGCSMAAANRSCLAISLCKGPLLFGSTAPAAPAPTLNLGVGRGSELVVLHLPSQSTLPLPPHCALHAGSSNAAAHMQCTCAAFVQGGICRSLRDCHWPFARHACTRVGCSACRWLFACSGRQHTVTLLCK